MPTPEQHAAIDQVYARAHADPAHPIRSLDAGVAARGGEMIMTEIREILGAAGDVVIDRIGGTSAPGAYAPPVSTEATPTTPTKSSPVFIESCLSNGT